MNEEERQKMRVDSRPEKDTFDTYYCIFTYSENIDRFQTRNAYPSSTSAIDFLMLTLDSESRSFRQLRNKTT